MPGRNKTAIIAMGGGMRSAYGAGFLYALATELGITSPDIVIGTSGNAGNSLYYVSGQYEFAKKVWADGILSTPKFISLLRFYRIMDIDYLIDTVIKKVLPLDIEALKNARSDYYIPITDIETGIPKYVGRDSGGDVFELLRAAKAAPFIFGKKILFRGHTYEDGEFGPTMLDHVEFAMGKGAKKILVVDNTMQWHGLKKLSMELYSLRFSKGLHRAVVRDLNGHSVCLTAEGTTILCIHPERLPAGLLTRDTEKLKKTFQQGFREALALRPELRTLFNTYI